MMSDGGQSWTWEETLEPVPAGFFLSVEEWRFLAETSITWEVKLLPLVLLLLLFQLLLLFYTKPSSSGTKVKRRS